MNNKAEATDTKDHGTTNGKVASDYACKASEGRVTVTLAEEVWVTIEE